LEKQIKEKDLDIVSRKPSYLGDTQQLLPGKW
jgi:hypothetical protein